MHPHRQYSGLPPGQFTVPPPGLPMQHQPGIAIQQAKTSANSRLVKYSKSDGGPVMGTTGIMPTVYVPPQTVGPPPLADRKKYTVVDARASCMLAQPLQFNSTHTVYVSHVENGPYNFCLQMKSSVEELLPKLRNILARHQVAAPLNAQLIPGSVVMARGGDDVLRRAVIMELKQDTCNVYYIDYGNKEERPYSDIFQLPNSAVELSPAMAMQFCLADIHSIKITEANKEYFTRLLLGKQVVIRVTESPRPAFQYCELFWEGRSMKEILVSLNSPTQYRNHITPSGDDTEVSVVFVEGPEQFYVHYMSELNNVNKIQETVEAYCREQPRLTDLSSVKIGSPVAAIFPDDLMWYRGLVVGINGDKIRVFYVDYGNSKEVNINQLCVLSPDLVTKWPSQAVTCCLVGFDAVPSSSSVADKMEEMVSGKAFKLKLHSILSGLRLTVDLIDQQGNSVAQKIKALHSEQYKSTSTETLSARPSALAENKKQPSYKPSEDDDGASQHTRMVGVNEPPAKSHSGKPGDGGGGKNKFQRPPLRADRERGERGNKIERGGRYKVEEKHIFTQHDDRSETIYQQKADSRSDWKKGSKQPHMDQAEEWNGNDKPSFHGKTDARRDRSGDTGFKKADWRHGNETSGDKAGWGADSYNRSRGERSDKGGWSNNRFERKPIPGSGDDENKNGDSGFKGSRFGSGKHGDRDSRYGDREKRFGDRQNSFGDRDKFGDKGKRFENRDGKFGDRDAKPWWNNNANSKPKSAAAPEEKAWDDFDDQQAAEQRPSVVISEYPHQPIVAGREYKVLFAGMDAPNDVYVHLADCDPVLDKIRALIDADATATSRPVSKPVLAMPVLARFEEDGLLYRALIKSLIKTEKGRVDVLYVDFGNSAVVSLKEVFTISAELMEIPIQAIHVIITDMPTLPAVDLNACQSHFMAEGLTLKPSSTTAINLVQCVQGTLVLPGGKSIAEVIKNDPKSTGSQTTTDGNDVPAAVTADVTTSFATNGEIEAIPVHWVERLDLLVGQTITANIIEKLDSDLYSVQATGCLGLVAPAQSESPLSSGLVVGNEVVVHVKALLQDRLLVRYYDVKGRSLSGGSSISSVCPLPIFKRKDAFVISHQENEYLYLQRADSGKALLDLLNDMFLYYDGKDTPKHLFKAGDVCAAQSLVDGNWYRAKIEGINDALQYNVRYVDYGNTEDLVFDNVRILSAEFTSPELCVRVALPVTYKDLAGCFASLDQNLECTFIKKDVERDCWIVDLYPVDSNKNFALEWIKEKKAESISSIPADPKLREPGWDLKKGDSVPIVVTHVDSPDAFWVQLSDSITDTDALQSKLQQLPVGDDTELGDIFVAKYAGDGLWYRAIRYGDEVRFIDYGNTDPAHERKKLPEELIHPAKGYALPLRLCVKPAGAEWTAEAKDTFNAFIEREDSNVFKKAEIVSVDFETIVDLKCGNDLLSATLITGNHAVPFEFKAVRQGLPPVRNEVLKDTCVQKPGPTIVYDEVPQGAVAGAVSAAVSVNDFYFQLDSKTGAIDKLAERLLAADAFEVIEEPSEGDYLIAKFPEDSQWYRAQVVAKDPLEVLHVDYGSVSPADEFRRLPPDVAALPVLAWHCSAGIDDQSANEKFLNGSNFQVTFTGIKNGGKHVVQVSVDGQSITASEPVKASVTESVTASKGDDKAQPEPTARTSNQNDLPTSGGESSPKDETEASKVPVPLSLDKPYYKDCILVLSNGPYDFYVQTDDVHIQVDEVYNALFKGGNLPKLDSVKEGDFVVAQFPEDDAYYRAVVVKEDPVVVHFPDYGNTCTVTSLHEMPAALKSYPALAVRCSLQSPPGGWSVDAIDKFTNLMEKCRRLDLKILSRGDPNIVDVEVNGVSFTEQLSLEPKALSDSVQNNENTEEAPEPTAERASPVKSQKDEFSVNIVFASSPSEFYFQEDEEKGAHLASRLMTAGEFKTIEKCEVGQMVCAIYPEDKSWYRAKVISTDPINVLFIDYGNVSEVFEVRELPQDLAEIPPLAVKASLQPQEPAWTTEETDKFLAVACAGELPCSVIERQPDIMIVRLNYENSDMIAYLGRCELASSSENKTSVEKFGTSSSDILSDLAEALKSNRELQETLDARLAREDLLESTFAVSGGEQNACQHGSSQPPLITDEPNFEENVIDLESTRTAEPGGTVWSVDEEPANSSIFSAETPEKCINSDPNASTSSALHIQPYVNETGWEPQNLGSLGSNPIFDHSVDSQSESKAAGPLARDPSCCAGVIAEPSFGDADDTIAGDAAIKNPEVRRGIDATLGSPEGRSVAEGPNSTNVQEDETLQQDRVFSAEVTTHDPSLDVPDEPRSISTAPVAEGAASEDDEDLVIVVESDSATTESPSAMESDSKVELNAQHVQESSVTTRGKCPLLKDPPQSSKPLPIIPEVIPEGRDNMEKNTPTPTTTGTPRKKPVKTVAEIKAQAKSRIFGASGRSPAAKLSTTPLATPSPRAKPPTSQRAKPRSSRLSPEPDIPSPSKEDKIIPGCVLGNN